MCSLFRWNPDAYVNMVIRPSRDLYTPSSLGGSHFEVGHMAYVRKDLILDGPRGQLKCSHFLPTETSQNKYPCVVYLHGNCSSRVEAITVLPALLQRGVTCFCLDLSGSGHSDGETISLGYHEEKDLEVALSYLRESIGVSAIGLWGRSMGAVTAIFRASEDPAIKACVLDSPFSDLRRVATGIAQQRFKMPSFVADMGVEWLFEKINASADFDPDEVEPISYVPDATCPVLFGAAYDDDLVPPCHSDELAEAWGGDQSLNHCYKFDGGHNGERPAWFIRKAADFLAEHLGAALQNRAPRESMVQHRNTTTLTSNSTLPSGVSVGGGTSQPAPRFVYTSYRM